MPFLAFLISVFFTAVLLPNKIGTPELPAIGAQRAHSTVDDHSIVPDGGRHLSAALSSPGIDLEDQISPGAATVTGSIKHMLEPPSCRLRI